LNATLNLLRGFELRCDGRRVTLPRAAQRVLAFLALNDAQLTRLYVAGVLWLDATEERACANLRSALWRVRREGAELVEADATQVRLGATVDVDVRRAIELSRGAIDRPEAAARYLRENIAGELLPDWYEEWVDTERERLHQLRLHALEAAAERLMGVGEFGHAVDAGLAAIGSDPLRESAHRVLIKIYVAEGNRTEALRQYGLYRRRLKQEVGLEPSRQMEELVADLRPSRRRS
jgi:DNA-binding SARP family transcriptional activator